MSETTIQEEIERLTTAKTNIISSITSKGGTVPSGSKLDALPSAISSIPSGGGAEDFGFGYITYHPETVSVQITDVYNCSVNVVDSSKFYPYLQARLPMSLKTTSGQMVKDYGKYSLSTDDQYLKGVQMWDSYTFEYFADENGLGEMIDSWGVAELEYDGFNLVFPGFGEHPRVEIPKEEITMTTGLYMDEVTEDWGRIGVLGNNFFLFTYTLDEETKNVKIPISKFEEMGLELTMESGGDYAYFSFEPSFTVLASTSNYALKTQEEFNALCSFEGTLSFPTGLSIRREAVTEYTFSDSYTLNYIPDSFLSNFKGLVSLNNFPSSVTTIGNNFLYRCYSFNQELSLDNIVTIGNQFLAGYGNSPYGHGTYNQKISLPSCTSIGSSFLYYQIEFNSEVYVPELTSLSNGFLISCWYFNQPVEFPKLSGTVPNSMLYDCRHFNQPFDLSNFTAIGDKFLYGCMSFEQELDFSTISTVGTYFLGDCSKFSQQELTFTSPSFYMGQGFMQHCDLFSGTINVTTSTVPTAASACLETTSNTAPLYNPGPTVIVPSSMVSIYKSALKKSTRSPFRNVTVVAAS